MNWKDGKLTRSDVILYLEQHPDCQIFAKIIYNAEKTLMDFIPITKQKLVHYLKTTAYTNTTLTIVLLNSKLYITD